MKNLILAVIMVVSIFTQAYAGNHFVVTGGKLEFDVEALYLQVCNALNVNPRDTTYTIILDGSSPRCIPDKKVIYLNKGDKYILAHEMAHLCCAERFWAEPNEKIAELIACYAEHSIRSQ